MNALFGNCEELAEYYDTPRSKRTAEQRIEAFKASYTQSIKWWEAFGKRNYETPTLSNGSMEVNVPSIIAEFKRRLVSLG